jgi:hypothetical protein
VHRDEALAIKEGQQHLVLSIWHGPRPLIGLDLPSSSTAGTVFWSQGGVRRVHHLVHDDNDVQHGETAAVEDDDELATDGDNLMFLFICEKFGDVSIFSRSNSWCTVEWR